MRIGTKRWVVFMAVLAGAIPARSVDLVVCDDIADPATLDPQKQFSEKNHTLLQQIYEGLVRFDADGHVEPALAMSWERVDPLRMRFHLRGGVSFHNGEPFTSAAVKFSIDRYLDPATGFPALGFLSSLTGAEIVDDLTIDLLTRYPDGILLNRLAGFVLIVPPGHTHSESDSLSRQPVGTGPFKFDGYEKGDRIVLSANRNYWMKGVPKVDRLIFRFIPTEKQVDEIFAGRVDILTELPGTRTLHMYENGGKVVKRETFYTVAITFRTDGPLGDLRVRQAMNYAVDKNEMIRYDLLTSGTPIGSLTFPGEFGHDPTVLPYPYDPVKAKQLMGEAGYPNGFKLRAFTKAQGARAASIIKFYLREIGIDLTVDVKTDAEIPAAVASGTYDIGIGGCPDPMSHIFFIQSIFLFSQSPYALGKNEEYDKKLLDMVFTLDNDEQGKKARALDRWVHDNAMGLFTYQRVKTYGCRAGVSFTPYVTGMPYFFLTEKK